MLRFTASRESVSRDGNANDNAHRKSYALKKEDSTSRPLLDRMHSVAPEHEKSKDDSSKSAGEESQSIASGNL